jgi:hypothetical protein
MADEQIPRKQVELRDDPKIISPPMVVDPLYSCSPVVKVILFIPLVTIDVELNGVIVKSVGVGFPDPNGALISMPSLLVAGQKIRARQRTASATSGWSNLVIVKNFLVDYPAGPPRPVINPAPVFECGCRTGVSNLLVGANAWITANAVEVGKVSGCNDHQGINVSPDYGIHQDVLAQSDLCGDKSPLSALEQSIGFPYPLPLLGFDAVYEGSQQIRITNVANGARVNLKVNGVNQGTSGCWGGSLLWGLGSPLPAMATLEATQTLCSGNPPSPPGTTTVQPCGNLPAPSVYPVQIGDDHIVLINHVWGATVKVYINNVKIGQGSGTVITLTQIIKAGDTILVGQEIGTCKSAMLTVVHPLCVAPPISFNPASLNLFPVGSFEYNQSGAKGSVYYPAQTDGVSTPFNKRLAKIKKVPFVVLAHGNHSESDPSYQGYDYFQVQLARMGFVVVSVDCNSVNGSQSGGGVVNIEARVDLIIQSIKLFQTFNASANHLLSNTIDFSQTGLMGHSRGGDAVVMAPEMIALADVSINAVLALAPTDFRGWAGTNVNPKKFQFMTILPAGDGDVWENNGARFYDRSAPGKFKTQLYIYYANHNYFNRQWVLDEGMGPARMQRFEHEEILSAYGCAFFRNVLQNDNSTFGFLVNRVLPSGCRVDNVHLAFQIKKSFTVDDHEQAGGIATNSMAQPTSQIGLTAKEFPFRQNDPGSFDSSFFGNTNGMVITYEKQNGNFVSPLKPVQNLKDKEIWIRVAEVFAGNIHPDTGFQLGLRDANGTTAFVDSNAVGGILIPYPHPNRVKSMLNTLRFRSTCFEQSSKRFNIMQVTAIVIRCNRPVPHPPLAFDDLQIV